MGRRPEEVNGDSMGRDEKLRREFERATLRKFLRRLKASEIELADELKMLEAYCELRKQDVAGRKVAVDAAREPGRSPSKRSRPASEDARPAATEGDDPDGDMDAELTRAVRRIYGVDLDA